MTSKLAFYTDDPRVVLGNHPDDPPSWNTSTADWLHPLNQGSASITRVFLVFPDVPLASLDVVGMAATFDSFTEDAERPVFVKVHRQYNWRDNGGNLHTRPSFEKFCFGSNLSGNGEIKVEVFPQEYFDECAKRGNAWGSLFAQLELSRRDDYVFTGDIEAAAADGQLGHKLYERRYDTLRVLRMGDRRLNHTDLPIADFR